MKFCEVLKKNTMWPKISESEIEFLIECKTLVLFRGMVIYDFCFHKMFYKRLKEKLKSESQSRTMWYIFESQKLDFNIWLQT